MASVAAGFVRSVKNQVTTGNRRRGPEPVRGEEPRLGCARIDVQHVKAHLVFNAQSMKKHAVGVFAEGSRN